MSEKISKEARSKNMRAIRSQSKLENQVSKKLWHRGYRFRKNTKSLFGKPDIAIKKYKIVIFIDSCFWHACPIHGNKPKNNAEYWVNKLHRNQERDREVNQYYTKKGWHLKRIWEHDIKEDIDAVIDEISKFIDKNRNVQ